MRLIEKLNANQCIHCASQNEFDKILALNNKNNCKNNDFSLFKEKSVYYPCRDYSKGDIFSIDYANANNHTIYSASEFIDTTFHWGQIIELSNDGINWDYKTFVDYNPIKMSEFKYIVVDEYGYSETYKYARRPVFNLLTLKTIFSNENARIN